MKLHELLNVISGGTPIKIYIKTKLVFSGCMANITESEFNKLIGEDLETLDVYRVNTKDGFITIAC